MTDVTDGHIATVTLSSGIVQEMPLATVSEEVVRTLLCGFSASMWQQNVLLSIVSQYTEE